MTIGEAIDWIIAIVMIVIGLLLVAVYAPQLEQNLFQENQLEAYTEAYDKCIAAERTEAFCIGFAHEVVR